MLRRVCNLSLPAAAGVRFATSDAGQSNGSKPDYSRAVDNATGKDNKAGVYSEKKPRTYFEEKYPNHKNELRSHQSSHPDEP